MKNNLNALTNVFGIIAIVLSVYTGMIPIAGLVLVILAVNTRERKACYSLFIFSFIQLLTGGGILSALIYGMIAYTAIQNWKSNIDYSNRSKVNLINADQRTSNRFVTYVGIFTVFNIALTLLSTNFNFAIVLSVPYLVIIISNISIFISLLMLSAPYFESIYLVAFSIIVLAIGIIITMPNSIVIYLIAIIFSLLTVYGFYINNKNN